MSRLRMGIIGCGAIAQIQHLPHLRELSDEFEIAGLCDLSARLLEALGDEYRVPVAGRHRDYESLLASDVDAVIVCPSGRHDIPSIAAARAGKHVFVEKPMCTTEAEARAMVAAADEAGIVLQVGYMKRHDPGYQYARDRVAEMPDARFIQVNHLHCDNSLHLRDFKVLRFDDVPTDGRAEETADRRQAIASELGYASPEDMPAAIVRAFGTILGSMIHDIGNLEGLFGPPTRVISTEIWADGRGINTVLEYPGEKRAVCTWVDLTELPEFTETLEIYGSRRRVRVSFPSGFARGADTVATIHAIEPGGEASRRTLTWHENPFKNEIRHFRQCIVDGVEPITPGRRVVADIALVRDIVRAYVHR
ncbi:MAG: Gfo/Idh/MocA family oxidoreductase [Chloroflexota bacterium]|nr:MAG: Gfo/Idh/MocA family oxidoreductase [Chloroflexota bacterium]